MQNGVDTLRRGALSLLVVLTGLSVAACGGGTTSRSVASRPTAPATPQCPAPVAVSSNDGQASTASPTGTLDGLVADPATSADDLTTALQTLAGNGGALGQQATRIETAVDAESPPPATSIEALARARWQHLDVDGTLATLSSSASTSCGDLFGEDALSSFSNELPAPDSDGAVRIRASDDTSTSAWPTAGCTTSDDLGYGPPETVVYLCDTGAVAVDLTSGETHVLADLLPPDSDARGQHLTLAGDHLAWVTVALTPASGLTKGSWTSTLHVIDLTGAEVAKPVLQAKHHTLDDSGAPTGVSEIVDGGAGWLLLSYLTSTDAYTYSLANAVGAVLGSAAYPDGDARPEPVGVVDLGLDPRAYVDEATGKLHPYGGSNRYNGGERVNDGGCGTDMIAGSNAGFFDRNPVPDTVEHFVRRASGLVVRKASTTTMFRGTDLRAGDVAALTPKGVLLTGPADGQWTFYGFAGAKRWSLGDPVVSVTNVAGHIVAVNTSGEQIVIDPATGKKARLSGDTEQVLDSLAPTSDQGDAAATIVFTDPAADSMLVQTTDDSSRITVRKVSYRAICG